MSERDEEQEFRDEQLRIELALSKFNNNKPQSTGFCLWCDEPVRRPNTDIYCCQECGIDHEKWQKANLRM